MQAIEIREDTIPAIQDQISAQEGRATARTVAADWLDWRTKCVEQVFDSLGVPESARVGASYEISGGEHLPHAYGYTAYSTRVFVHRGRNRAWYYDDAYREYNRPAESLCGGFWGDETFDAILASQGYRHVKLSEELPLSVQITRSELGSREMEVLREDIAAGHLAIEQGERKCGRLDMIDLKAAAKDVEKKLDDLGVPKIHRAGIMIEVRGEREKPGPVTRAVISRAKSGVWYLRKVDATTGRKSPGIDWNPEDQMAVVASILRHEGLPV